METLVEQTRKYLRWMRGLNYSPRTIEAREGYLKKLNEWLEDRAITDPKEVEGPTLESYRRHVGRQLRKDGKALSFRTQRNRLVPVKGFFKWLRKVKAIPTNPAADLDMPRQEKRLPRVILSEKETSLVLASPDVSTASGLRDRAMMETFYSTGIRRAELAALDIRDVDAGRGLVSVKGKGRKDRMVAISESSIDWIARYLEESRPELITPASPEQLLFLNDQGRPWRLEYLSALVKKNVIASGVEKLGGCHLFRHACATHMLDHGADIRHVQEQLGHASLQTTQIYTHVSLMKLKEAHRRTHPSARLEPSRKAK